MMVDFVEAELEPTIDIDWKNIAGQLKASRTVTIMLHNIIGLPEVPCTIKCNILETK